MSMDALIAPVRRVALFQGLRPIQITEIARRAERIVFGQGDLITEAGVDGDATFIIISGLAERVSGLQRGEVPEPVAPGSLIAEMAMLVPHEYGATVIARGPVRALKITREDLREQMLADPSLAEHLMHQIAGRLTKVAEELRRLDKVLAGGSTQGYAETTAPIAVH